MTIGGAVFLVQYTQDKNRILYLESWGDLVRGSIMGINRVTVGFIGVINQLTKSPSPSRESLPLKYKSLARFHALEVRLIGV